MLQPENSPKDPQENRNSDPLQDLTTFPSTFWNSYTKSIDQSREDISLAVQEAMREKELSVYALFERTGLSTDLIYSIIEGTYDLSDSEPISKLEEALGVKLNHL